jgi:SagB-type dehydrogenase family enzyme
MEQRISVRRYSEDPLSLEELSYLLWLTQGVKTILPNTLTMRTVPSAGARHPFETWLSINRVETLIPGLYHFEASSHELEQVKLGEEYNQQLTQAILNQQQVATSAVTFIWVAHPYRTSWRYGSRAYRYICLDAGNVCQNLHLAAESIGCGVCAIGAYDDDAVNRLLELDGEEQFVIYMASLGRKLTDEVA